MNVISRKRLELFWLEHVDAQSSLKSWYINCRKASWSNLDEVRKIYPHADAVGDCTVFNVSGNKYRLIVKIRYKYQRIYVIRVMSHKEYDRGKWKDEC